MVRATRWTLTRRPIVAGLVSLMLAGGAASCGGGEDSSLSELGKRGKDTANANGCASCHGANGQGGVGPSWIDLAGSSRELTDGTTVVADDDYLLRAILAPEVEVVAGYSIRMPTNGLNEDEASNVIRYIKELTSDEP